MKGPFGTLKEYCISDEAKHQAATDGNPVHLLRQPRGKRCTVGGQDRTNGAYLAAT